MPKATTGTRGARAEAIAAGFLQQRGLVPLERNYRCRGGEIDLVCRDGQHLVFVEVRLRSSQAFGGAAASVTPAKQKRLIIAAQHYLQQNYRNAPPACRFDLVAMRGMSTQQLEWIRDAFRPSV